MYAHLALVPLMVGALATWLCNRESIYECNAVTASEEKKTCGRYSVHAL